MQVNKFLPIAAITILLSLNGCSLVVGGIVGAAVQPFVQPVVDRVLDKMGLDFVDPGGVAAVKDKPIVNP